MEEMLTKTILNYEDFAMMFGLWAPKFREFIEGEEMYKIYQRLKEDSRKEIICPRSDETFRAFSLTNPENVKSIWYMMDPYPRRYKDKVLQADGIAMSCSHSPDGKIQPSLQKFYEGIEDDLGILVDRSISLDYLCEQGVMMLNSDLTVKLNKSGSHEGLWAPFQKYFLEEVMRGTTGVVYVLAGKSSQRMERYINPLGNYIFKIEHPVAASYKDTTWNHEKIFTRINKILHDNNNGEISWDRRRFEQNRGIF